MTVAHDHDLSTSSSLAHIARLSSKIEALSRARDEAELQAVHRIGQQYAAGELTFSDLMDLYQQVRVTFGPGFSRKWNDAVPIKAGTLVNPLLNRPNGPHGTWIGEFPLPPRAVAPVNGHSVVYVLFDQDNVPCYVGSTGRFRERMRQHRDDKPPGRWQAHPCTDREHAYTVEDRLLKEHKPYLNRRAAA